MDPNDICFECGIPMEYCECEEDLQEDELYARYQSAGRDETEDAEDEEPPF